MAGAGSFASGLARGLQSGVNWTGVENDASAIDRMRNRKAIARIDKAATGEYEAAGKPGTFDDFYRDFIVPKKTQEFLSQGDMESAEAWREWAESDAARDGSKLFADGIVKAQAGDTEGALRNFIKAGNLRGYGKDLDLGNLTHNDDGSITINFDAPNGRKLAQTFTSPEEVLSFGSTFFNPEAAFERWNEQQKAAATTEGEIDQYRREKEIDVQLGISGPGSKESKRAENYDKARSQALEELQADMNFMDLKAKKQQRAIEQRTNEILRGMGQKPPRGDKPARPSPTKAFNTKTGEVTDIDQAEAAPAPTPRGSPEPPTPGATPAPGTGTTTIEKGDRLTGGAGQDRLAGGKGNDVGLGGQRAAGPSATASKGDRQPVRQRQPEASRGVVGITGQITGSVAPASSFAEQYPGVAPAAAAPQVAPVAAPAPARAPAAAPPIASKAVIRRMAAELSRMKPGSPEYQQLASQIRSSRNAA